MYGWSQPLTLQPLPRALRIAPARAPARPPLQPPPVPLSVAMVEQYNPVGLRVRGAAGERVQRSVGFKTVHYRGRRELLIFCFHDLLLRGVFCCVFFVYCG